MCPVGIWALVPSVGIACTTILPSEDQGFSFLEGIDLDLGLPNKDQGLSSLEGIDLDLDRLFEIIREVDIATIAKCWSAVGIYLGAELWAWGAPPGGTLNGYSSWSKLRGEAITMISIGIPSCRDAIHCGRLGGGMVGRQMRLAHVEMRGLLPGVFAIV